MENFQDEKNLSSNRSNNARRRLIEESTIESFSEGDLPKVQKIYAGLNRDKAKSNEKVQQEDGIWTTAK